MRKVRAMIEGLDDDSRQVRAPMNVTLMALALVCGAGLGAAIGLVDGDRETSDVPQFAMR